jgi:hypothetical protein
VVGAPAKPITATSSGTSDLTRLIVSPTKPTRSGSRSPNEATSARVWGRKRGPGSKVMSTPIASRGVMMSAKITAPSMPKRRIGCSVISAATSGVATAS